MSQNDSTSKNWIVTMQMQTILGLIAQLEPETMTLPHGTSLPAARSGYWIRSARCWMARLQEPGMVDTRRIFQYSNGYPCWNPYCNPCWIFLLVKDMWNPCLVHMATRTTVSSLPLRGCFQAHFALNFRTNSEHSKFPTRKWLKPPYIVFFKVACHFKHQKPRQAFV